MAKKKTRNHKYRRKAVEMAADADYLPAESIGKVVGCCGRTIKNQCKPALMIGRSPRYRLADVLEQLKA